MNENERNAILEYEQILQGKSSRTKLSTTYFRADSNEQNHKTAVHILRYIFTKKRRIFMVSRKTQKDVGKFKAKLAGPFTARQTVFIGMGTAVDILVCSAMHGAGFDINVIAAVCICIIAPFVLFGTVNPYGMTCEKFLYQFYIYHIVAPSVRKYCTHTALDDINTEISPEDKKKMEIKKKKMSKHTEIKGYHSFE